MNELSERIVESQEEIARLEALCRVLDDQAQVRLRLADGSYVDGVVAVRPSMQTFRLDGREGTNALLRLEPLSGTTPPRYLWLDGVAEVIRLGTA